MYKSQQSDHRPRSPVSPLESNGETWKYPPRAKAHLKGLGTLYEIPLKEAPKDLFRSRPMSYYDGLQASPEPEDKAVFADLPAAPAAKRLSRPFEQPYPTYNQSPTSAKGQALAPPANTPMQANLSRADSHLRRQPAGPPARKAIPAPISVPKPAHQSTRQREPNLYQENKVPAQRSGRNQGKQAPAQRPPRHQGWNPLEEPPHQQRTAARAHHQDHRRDHHRRGEDVEWYGELKRSNNRSKHKNPQHKDRWTYFFALLIAISLGIVVIVVAVEKSKHE